MTKKERIEKATKTAMNQMQTFDTQTLLSFANDEIDAKTLAQKTLAGRGLGLSGKWVGFGVAKIAWQVKEN